MTPMIAGKSSAPRSQARLPRFGGLLRKYALLFIGLVGLALVGSAGVDLYFSYGEQKELLLRLQQEQAVTASRRIEQFIEEIQRQIGWTTHAQWGNGPVEQRRFDYVRLLRQVPAITEVSQLDGEGREQLKVSRLAMDTVASNIDFSKDPRFTEAVSRKVWFSPVYFRKESEPYLTISIARSGRNAGVTVAEINLKHIWDVIQSLKIGRSGYAYVVDQRGRLIAHPDISLVLRNTDLSDLPQVEEALHSSPYRSGLSGVLGPDGRRVISAHAAIPNLGWLVFVELPYSEALEPVFASIARALVVLGVGLLLAAVAAFLLARRMVVPIRQLQEGASQIGEGKLDHRIHIETGDELEGLARQFNDMAGQLAASYGSLERQVEERTRKLEEQSESLRQASQHKSQFLANMSHELRTPLNAILGYTELLVDGIYGELPEKPRGVLERVQANGKHLLGLINDVLDLSKIEAGQLNLAVDAYTVEELVSGVMSATESLARNKGLALEAEIAPQLPTGQGDGRRLSQVLLNLVGNAIKFTDVGEVRITARAEADNFALEVRDSGPGIAPEDLQKIFEEFQQVDNSSTRKKGGTGLGLAISRRIVEMHGGALTVESTVGVGSVFRVVVPVKVVAGVSS